MQRRVRLRIKVDKHDLLSARRKRRAEIDGSRRLADAPFLIHYRNRAHIFSKLCLNAARPAEPYGGAIGRVRSGKYNRKGQTAQDEGGDFLADSAPRRDGSHGLNSGSLGSALNIAFAFCIAKAARLAPCGLRWPVIQTTRQKEGHALMIPKMSGASRIIDAST